MTKTNDLIQEFYLEFSKPLGADFSIYEQKGKLVLEIEGVISKTYPMPGDFQAWLREND